MEIAPFTIKKLTLDTARLRVSAQAVNQPKRTAQSSEDFPAYLVTSTAPHNIDQVSDELSADSLAQTKQGLAAIARHLHRIQTDDTIGEAPELVIAVHGYNTDLESIQAWYSDIYRYIAQDDRYIRQRKNSVFIGYRWSSERLSLRPKHLWANIRALPDVPQGVLAVGLLFVLLYWGCAFFSDLLKLGRWPDLLMRALFGGAIATTVMILTLLLLRLSVYFRDVYRAQNFGVPDLTELIRQIDQAVMDLRRRDIEENAASYREAIRQAKLAHDHAPPRTQLTFLGHSMGALVITNVVRILSDVFDRGSILQNPTPEIGDTLSLDRLVLASPDIPVLSIISGRANGLASSLRRFNEAYLFSNEGDLALRLASTAVNYISFPSAKQNHGHRLGSIALTRRPSAPPGIVNLPELQAHYALPTDLCEAMKADPLDILKCLFITRNSGDGSGYLSLGKLFEKAHKASTPATLADLFTFFDCTDYKDYRLSLAANGRRERSPQQTGLLTRAKGKNHLNTWDYTELLFDMVTGRRDVHGGYFKGEYSRELIYRVAFLGFERNLQVIAHEMGTEGREKALDALNDRCIHKGIQVYLSPLRYRVDVQGADMSDAREEMLRAMRAEQLSERAEPMLRRSMPLAS
jgi:hypothetical protein